MSVRDVYEGLLARASKPDKVAEYEAQLSCPQLPPALAYLWKIYRRLRRRKGGGFGLSPIEWPDIDAFLRHAKIELVPWEIEMLEDLDDLFLNANAPTTVQAPAQPES